MFQKKKTQTRLSRQVINLSDAVPLSVRNDESNPPIVRELVLFFCVCLFQIAGDMYLIRTPSTVVEIPYVLYWTPPGGRAVAAIFKHTFSHGLSVMNERIIRSVR